MEIDEPPTLAVMKFKRLILRVVAASEAIAGATVLAYPPIGAQLLLDSEIAGAGIFMSRIAGITLISFGIACWPGRATGGLLGMTVYGGLVAAYFAVIGVTGGQTGILFWPAFVVHVVLTIFFAWALLKK